jgi:hypothetical protein
MEIYCIQSLSFMETANCYQSDKSVLTSAAGMQLFYCMTLLVHERGLYVQQRHKVSCMSKSSLQTRRDDQNKTATVYFQSGYCRYCMYWTVPVME